MKKDFNESVASLLEKGYFSRVLVDDFSAFRQISDDHKNVLDTIAHFDQRDAKAIFLTESSVYLTDVLQTVFSGDFRVFLVPPPKLEYMTHDEYLDYVHYQNYCCCVRMMSAFQFDWEIMDDQLDYIAVKIRERFPIEVRRSELFKPCILRDKMTLCVITDLSLLEPAKVNVEWNCIHSPSGDADPVALSTGVPEQYHEFCDDGNPRTNGQMKLAVCEMQFLINMRMLGRSYDAVLFIGAAPGIHIPVVMDAFPGIRYYAIDPSPIIPYENLTIIPFSDNPDFVCLERMLGPRYNLLVISDVFVPDPVQRHRITDTYLESISQFCNVVAIMEKLFVDYMLPYTTVRHDAQLFFQPYLKGESSEYRMVWYPGAPLVNMCSRMLDNKVNYFKRMIRPKTCKNGRCYECHYTWLVLNMACAISGVDVSDKMLLLRDKKLPLPLVYTAMLKLKNGTKAIKANKRGVHISGKGYPVWYAQYSDGYHMRVGDSVMLVSTTAHSRGYFYDVKVKPPEFSKAAICLVNSSLPMILPSYVKTGTSSVEVRLRDRRYRFSSLDLPSCPICVTPGPSLTVYIKEFGDVVLPCCGREFVYSGELSWSRMSVGAQQEDDLYHF